MWEGKGLKTQKTVRERKELSQILPKSLTAHCSRQNNDSLKNVYVLLQETCGYANLSNKWGIYKQKGS